VINSMVLFIRLSIDPLCEVPARDGSHLIRMKPLDHFLQVDYTFLIVIYMFLKINMNQSREKVN